jgi:predicted MFS family arabinose efflux permease
MRADPGSMPTTARSYFVVVVLAGVYALSFLDRQLVSILAEPIKADLGLSDTQLGMLSGLTFALFYSVFGIPVAWLADRSNRVHIVASACALWSLFTAACGLAQTFSQMALARIGVGVGEAGGSPPSYSIIADYFPPEKRAGAMALYSLGVPLGTTAGAALGGLIASSYGWRAAFLAIGAIGIIYSLIVVVSVREPQRGRLDKIKGEAEPLKATAKAFVTNPTLRLTAVGAGLSAFVGYAMLSWTPALLMRTKGMSLSELAVYYSIVSGAAAAVGTLLSGYLVDKLGQRDPRMYGLVPAAAFLVSVPFYVAGIYATSWPLALLFMSVPFAFYAAYLPPALAIIQNTVSPTQRSTASSFFILVLSLVGLGGGPVFIGAISDGAASSGYANPLQFAMFALAPVFAMAALAHFGVARSLAKQTRESGAGPTGGASL